MSRVAYVNGRYLAHADAAVHIEDRGLQFADGVYEVWAVLGGKLADMDGHLARLARSLGELRIEPPMSMAALHRVLREVVRRNRVREGLVYLQVTRGVASRDHAFPKPGTSPTMILTARRVDLFQAQSMTVEGVAVITRPDQRWARCDIKTVGLLPNVLAKQAAREAGAYEAWLVDGDGLVTEGASTNAWIVDRNGALRTRSAADNILRGVTRQALLGMLPAEGLELSEQAFTIAEAEQAREAFVTAASTFVMPVVAIDGRRIGDGRPGPVALRLRSLYLEQARLGAV